MKKRHLNKVVKDLLKTNGDKKTVETSFLCLHNPLTILYNKFIFSIVCKWTPSELKNKLLLTTRIKIGKNVKIHSDVKFDPYFPELIEIKSNSLIGSNCVFSAHNFRNNKLTLQNITIDENSIIDKYTIFKP